MQHIYEKFMDMRNNPMSVSLFTHEEAYGDIYTSMELEFKGGHVRLDQLTDEGLLTLMLALKACLSPSPALAHAIELVGDGIPADEVEELLMRDCDISQHHASNLVVKAFKNRAEFEYDYREDMDSELVGNPPEEDPGPPYSDSWALRNNQ